MPAHNRSIANMAADGTNSASALSLGFCFRGRNTIGLRFLYLAFRTGIKLQLSADGTILPATFSIPVRCVQFFMTRKSLLNQLELAYAPLTAYEFAMLKDDALIERALEKASLYAIGQRPVITFENVIPDQLNYLLNFEIHQKGNSEILKCRLPLVQSVVGSTDEDTIAVAFNYLDKTVQQNSPPFNNIHGFFHWRKCSAKLVTCAA